MYLWFIYFLFVAVVISFAFYFLINLLNVMRDRNRIIQDLVNVGKEISKSIDPNKKTD